MDKNPSLFRFDCVISYKIALFHAGYFSIFVEEIQT